MKAWNYNLINGLLRVSKLGQRMAMVLIACYLPWWNNIDFAYILSGKNDDFYEKKDRQSCLCSRQTNEKKSF